MKMLERARAEGVPTAVISGQGAPGAEIETSVVERSAAYTASHTGAMLRLAQLATALGADLGSLNGVPDSVEAVVEGPAVGVVPPRRAMEFVGAGPNQWTAAEGALKVRETAYVASAGMGVEQFLHGPSVAVGTDDTLVCLDGGGPGSERLAQVARSAGSAGVPVRMIAADAPNELLSVFPLTAVVQRIALETAETLGTNPDSFGRDVPARARRWTGLRSRKVHRVSSTLVLGGRPGIAAVVGLVEPPAQSRGGCPRRRRVLAGGCGGARDARHIDDRVLELAAALDGAEVVLNATYRRRTGRVRRSAMIRTMIDLAAAESKPDIGPPPRCAASKLQRRPAQDPTGSWITCRVAASCDRRPGAQPSASAFSSANRRSSSGTSARRLGRFTTIPSCVVRASTTIVSSSGEGFSSRCGT